MKRIRTFLLITFLAIVSVVNIKYVSADEVKLKSFEIKTKELFQKEKIYYDIDYEGKVSFIGIWAKEKTTNEVFYISTSNLSDGYFDLSVQNGNTHSGTGTYQLIGVTLGKENGITYYSTNGCNESETNDCVKYDFSNIVFTIKTKEETITDDIGIFDYILTMDNQQVYVGDKVKVNFGSPQSFNGKEINEKPVSNVMLSFTNQSNGDILNAYLNSLDDNPYFIVPSTAKPGIYNINYGYLTFTDGTSEKYQNKPGKVFSYEGTFEIKEKELNKDNYSFNSEDYNLLVKNDLEKLNNDAIITINANNSPIIYKELFELVQSTNRTLIIDYQNMRWIFNGNDVVNPKTIEVSAKMEEFLAENVESLKNKIQSKSILLEFTNNGDLPGKTLIKLNSKDIEKYFDSEVLYVYYYDESENSISKVAMEVQKSDGFFEFYINHNSKYILASQEVKDIENDSALNENEKGKDITSSKNNTVLYTVIGLIVALCAIISIVIVKKKKEKM